MLRQLILGKEWKLLTSQMNFLFAQDIHMQRGSSPRLNQQKKN